MKKRKETRRGKKNKFIQKTNKAAEKNPHFMHSERVAAGNEKGGRT